MFLLLYTLYNDKHCLIFIVIQYTEPVIHTTNHTQVVTKQVGKATSQKKRSTKEITACIKHLYKALVKLMLLIKGGKDISATKNERIFAGAC